MENSLCRYTEAKKYLAEIEDEQESSKDGRIDYNEGKLKAFEVKKTIKKNVFRSSLSFLIRISETWCETTPVEQWQSKGKACCPLCKKCDTCDGCRFCEDPPLGKGCTVAEDCKECDLCEACVSGGYCGDQVCKNTNLPTDRPSWGYHCK